MKRMASRTVTVIERTTSKVATQLKASPWFKFWKLAG